MKRCATVLFTTIVILMGCTKSTNNGFNEEIIKGTFKGEFIRNTTDTALITIVFDNNYGFTGTSNKIYPNICNGKVAQSVDMVTFQSACYNFQSVDYLSGDYFYTYKDGKLSLWKTLNSVSVSYKLVKQ